LRRRRREGGVVSAATAAGHVAFETLLAWWLHETDAAATDAVDEHLLRCDACGETLDALVGLADGVRAAFDAGLVGAVVSGGFVERAAARGRKVREYRLALNGGVDCTVAPDDELLVSRLEAPLAGVERVDAILEFSHAPGVRHRIDDVPFDVAAGEVVYLPKIAEVKRAPANTHSVTLIAARGGSERALGTYTFRHRPWPGG
jgi:hypothetical protein